MKVQFTENDDSFAIHLTAETPVEMAALVRFGMNRTDEIRSVGSAIFKDATTAAHIAFAKSKRADANIPRRKSV